MNSSPTSSPAQLAIVWVEPDLVFGVNSFTNIHPRFPYESSEAREQLNLDDWPVVHLAITSLAHRLLFFTKGSPRDIEELRIAALRTASGGVLECLSWEVLLGLFWNRIGVEVPNRPSYIEMTHKRTRWLHHAHDHLKVEGHVMQPQDWALPSPYGWRGAEKPVAIPPVATAKPDSVLSSSLAP